MSEAALRLVGAHDFVGFAAQESRGCTVRNVFRADVRVIAGPMGPLMTGREMGAEIWQTSWHAASGTSAGGRLIAIEVEANAFLRHMVRRIVGSLVRVGLGRSVSGDIAAVLARREKAGAGPTAPAHGLDLYSVAYRDASMVSVGRLEMAQE